jgi:hypothetical protein
MLEKKYYLPKEDLEEDVLKRVLTGLYDSKETRPFIVNYALENDVE